MLPPLHVLMGVGRLEGQGLLSGQGRLGMARQTLYDLRELKKLKRPFRRSSSGMLFVSVSMRPLLVRMSLSA